MGKGFESFLERVAATAIDRIRVRTLATSGQWKRAEKDSDRFRTFAAKRIMVRTKGGAESIQGDSLDYQPASFLSEGAIIRRAVAYVEASFGTMSTTGTGFMISPQLFITNQHVIPNKEAALGATIIFDRELDELGRPRATTSFTLNPSAFALFSDEDELDYAVVAVGERQSGVGDLTDFGYCVLSNAPDKHVVGMNINIIQHPLGQRKLISIRKNLLVARTPRTLLYETDTQVGSSGSPVFNDDWEVVALHHYGEPSKEIVDDQGNPLPHAVNEGIRISTLLEDLAARRGEVPLQSQPPLDEALELGKKALQAITTPRLGLPKPKPAPAPTPAQPESNTGIFITDTQEINTMANSVEFVVPLRISVSLDGASPTVAAATAISPTLTNTQTLTRRTEAIKIDADYSNRSGYATDFIPGENVPLPRLNAELENAVAPLRATEPDATKGELKYEHFSIKVNRTRQMAIFTATNIDGETYLAVDRSTGKVKATEGEKWFKDPRISESFTLNQDFYSEWSTYFDRGHLTRRTDPTWGATNDEAERANADTYHFTNCSPQHFRFNQTVKFWQGVERYVLETGVLAQDSMQRLCVFQGPIFDDDIDRMADDIQIPSSFFKIVVWRGAEKLKAVGLVVDQGALLDEPRIPTGQPKAPEHVSVKEWRVSIESIEQRTGLNFGTDVRKADTITQVGQPSVGEEAVKGILLRSLTDIVL